MPLNIEPISDLGSPPSGSNGEVLVRVDGASKKFCRSLKKSLWYGACDMAAELNPFAKNEKLKGEIGNESADAGLTSQPSAFSSGPSLRPDEFWAVNDVSFELRRGECLGLIGRNGAGKTTLLKMLNGLIKPDKGRIEMRGRVGALIALGAGFNPVLTGRENIYVNGSVLGLTKPEIDAKIAKIVDFAEIGEFIDSPVQSYSSGMNVRLGFAVAVNLIEPDVLFLDEVLAVGDIGFTIKCLNAVRRLAESAAVVFVSHNMQFVSAFCSRVIVMERGARLLDATNPADGIDRYFAMVKLQRQQSGTGEARVLALTMGGDLGNASAESEPSLKHGQHLSITLIVEVQEPRVGAHLHLYIMDESMVPVICLPIHDSSGDILTVKPGPHRLNVPLGSVELASGKYSFTVAISDTETQVSLCRVQGLLPFRVFAEKTHWGKIVRPVVASSLHINN